MIPLQIVLQCGSHQNVLPLLEFRVHMICVHFLVSFTPARIIRTTILYANDFQTFYNIFLLKSASINELTCVNYKFSISTGRSNRFRSRCRCRNRSWSRFRIFFLFFSFFSSQSNFTRVSFFLLFFWFGCFVFLYQLLVR